jgi:hypothetical protein
MTTHLPHGDKAILDIRKIEDYCLNPSHPRGRHRARVFREALDLQRDDAAWLRDALLEAARAGEAFPIAVDPLGDPLAPRCDHQATRQERCGKNDLDRAIRRERAGVRHLLGAMMKAKNERPSVLDVVALLTDLPTQRLARGQVGTIVEQLDDTNLLVEFSDDQGHAYAVAPCPQADQLVLHYVPEAA